MKFGKQLEFHAHGELRDKFVSYKRLKRLIKRQRFLLDEQEKAGGQAKETSPLLSPDSVREQFFRELAADLEVVNNYFLSKVAELTVMVESLEGLSRQQAQADTPPESPSNHPA
eukprot:RCo004020